MRRYAAGLSSFLFAVILSVPTTAGSSACPVSPPVPLRGLYIKSDLVVVGKIGKPGKWIVQPREERGEGESENYRSYNRAVPVQIEETIKGSAPKDLLIREAQTKWVGPAVEQKPQTPGIAATPDEPEFSSSLAEDTGRRLFFLNTIGDGSTSYQETYAGRRFQPQQKDLPLFISRLRELNAIYSAPVPSKQMIVEWVVAMAEDPVTRYEGAYELRQALYNSQEEEPEESEQADTADEDDADEDASTDDAAAAEDTGQENAAITANTDAAPETNENTLDAISETSISAETLPTLPRGFVIPGLYQDYRDTAKLLTPNQKERLIQAFLNTRFTYKVAERSESDEAEDEDAEDGEDEGPPEIKYADVLSEADALLLSAVGELNDRRVIHRIVTELPTVNKYGPREAYTMIGILSAYFDDEKLEKLSDKYADVYWGDENELIDEEESAEDALDAPAASAADKTPGDPPVTQADDEARALKKARQENYVPSKTYGRRRSELLAQVLVRCSELGEKKAKGK